MTTLLFDAQAGWLAADAHTTLDFCELAISFNASSACGGLSRKWSDMPAGYLTLPHPPCRFSKLA